MQAIVKSPKAPKAKPALKIAATSQPEGMLPGKTTARKRVKPVMSEEIIKQRVMAEIKNKLASRGIHIAFGEDEGKGPGSLSVSVTPKSQVSTGVDGQLDVSDLGNGSEVDTQYNVPWVFKFSGPLTIDIGAVFLNSND